MQKLYRSQFVSTVYLLACVALCYGVILGLRVVYRWVGDIGAPLGEGGAGWLVSMLQYGLGSFGMAMVLAGVFTLLELGSTGRARVNSTYGTSFGILFLSFVLFYGVIYVFERVTAAWHLGPVFDFTGQAHSVLVSYGLVLGYFFLSDVALYWLHRYEHVNKFLWYFHAIHHAAEDLDSVSGAFHPVSNVIRWVLTVLPLKFLLAINMADTLVLSSFVIGLHYMQHARTPYNFGWFGVVLGDNRFHFVHHSKNPKFYNKNYAALFPVIDMMFGTYQRPDPIKLPKTGLRDRRGASSLAEFFSGKLRQR